MFRFISLMLGVSVLLAPLVAQSTNDKEEFDFTRQQISHSHTFMPNAGIVPDSPTATAIAYAIGVPVYGKKRMDDEQPFRADLKGGVWTVLGTLHCKSCVGGTLVVQIDKITGKVLYLSHFQ